jgi:hypothetical protein
MSSRECWYFTFCLSNEFHKNHYVKFEGSWSEARERMVENFGTKWAFQYSEAEFAGQPEQYGYTELIIEED